MINNQTAATYDALTKAWRTADELIGALRLPVFTPIVYDRGEDYEEVLAWACPLKTWTICHAVGDGDQPLGELEYRPIAECSVQVRTEAVHGFALLYEAINKRKPGYLNEIETATLTLNQAIEAISNG